MASNIPPAIGVHQSGVRGSIPRLVLFLVAVVALLAMGWAIRPLEDGDLFTHIVLGRHLFESPVLTASESGQRVWISWLAYLVFGGVDAALGLPGIKALNLILLWGAFISAGMWCAMLLRPCSQSSQTRVVPLALGVLSAWVVSLTNVAARPQSFAYLAFAVCLLLLECGAQQRLKRRRLVLALLPTFVVWQNFHPSVVLALPLVLCYCLRRAVPWWMVMTPLLAMMATPDGFNIFHLSAVNMSISRDLLGVSEWLSPWHPEVRGAMLGFWWIASLTILAVAIGLVRGWEIPRTAAALSAIFFGLTLTSSRFDVFWAFVNIPLVAAVVERVWRAPLGRLTLEVIRGKAALGATVLVTCANLMLCRIVLEKDNPLAMLQEVKRDYPTARIFNYREAGGLLEYVGYPQWRPYIDGRLYLFDRAVWDRYHSIALATDNAAVEWMIEQHDLLVLHESYHAPLIRSLASRSGVLRLREAGKLIVYVRRLR